MTCATISAIAGAVTIPLIGGYSQGPENDVIVLAPHPTAVAQFCYYNHAAPDGQDGQAH